MTASGAARNTSELDATTSSASAPTATSAWFVEDALVTAAARCGRRRRRASSLPLADTMAAAAALLDVSAAAVPPPPAVEVLAAAAAAPPTRPPIHIPHRPLLALASPGVPVRRHRAAPRAAAPHVVGGVVREREAPHAIFSLARVWGSTHAVLERCVSSCAPSLSHSSPARKPTACAGWDRSRNRGLKKGRVKITSLKKVSPALVLSITSRAQVLGKGRQNPRNVHTRARALVQGKG